MFIAGSISGSSFISRIMNSRKRGSSSVWCSNMNVVGILCFFASATLATKFLYMGSPVMPGCGSWLLRTLIYSQFTTTGRPCVFFFHSALTCSIFSGGISTAWANADCQEKASASMLKMV